MFDVLEAVGMTEDILIETHGKTSWLVCQAHPIASGTVGRMAGDSWAQLPKADDPLAGITSANFMKLAWRIATEKARELGWIV